MTDANILDAMPAQQAKSRLPIVLLLDTSDSMRASGGIGQLNEALAAWHDELRDEDYIARVGEIAMVTFGEGGVRVIDATGQSGDEPADPFVSVDEFDPPVLEAGGVTPMVEGIERAIELVRQRKNEIRSSGLILAHRPLIYMITDGAPTNSSGKRSQEWKTLTPTLRDLEEGKHLLFFAFGVEGADEAVLRGLAPEAWHLLAGLKFAQFLRFVSTSVEQLSKSGNADQPASEAYRQIEERQSQEDRINEYLKGVI